MRAMGRWRMGGLLGAVLLLLSVGSAGALEIPAELKGTLVRVFAAGGDLNAIFTAFTEATGIRVEFLDMSSGEVLARIRGENGRPSGDVWFGGGVDSYVAAAADGLLEPYVSPESQAIDARFRDPDGYWTGIGLAVATFVVNSTVCGEKGAKIPATWEDLLQPALKGEVLMANPAVSGTAYFILGGLLQTLGEERGWIFLDRLHGQIPFYAKRGGEPGQKAGLGEVAVGLHSGTGDDLKKEGYPVETVFPQDGVPWFPSPVAILKGAENPAGARVLVDWVLSEAGQTLLRELRPSVPTRQGIAVPASYAPILEARLMSMDFGILGRERDRIVAEWQRRYGQ